MERTKARESELAIQLGKVKEEVSELRIATGKLLNKDTEGGTI